MIKKLSLLAIVAVTVFGIVFSAFRSASADFNANNLISNAAFDNYGTMSVSQINAFLNSFPSSCISTNNGFQAIAPIGYSPSTSYKYGPYVSAGEVIYNAAQAYEINPQVLLATLQKEQSLVTGTAGCTTKRYTAAVGYGCPDSGTTHSYSGLHLYAINGQEVTSVSSTCVNSAGKAGFSQQVIRAAWLLKFGRMRAEGYTNWAIVKGNWDNSDDPQSCYGGPMTQGTYAVCPSGSTTYYDGYRTIDGTAVHMDNGATAALYWYTPHLSGNQHFVSIYTNWFVPYNMSFYGQNANVSVNVGATAPVSFMYKNTGSASWYDDTSAGAAGAKPVHLATSGPLNRLSAFGATWPGKARPATTFSAVYNSDGTTLASNQHRVDPGQVVKFTFTITGANIAPGTYKEYFTPIVEGTSTGELPNVGTYATITVNKNPSFSWVSQNMASTLTPSDSTTASLYLKNNGNVNLYDDASIGSAPAGNYPVHLATANPVNRSSVFSKSWPSAARAANKFAAVYESNGTTLASNQHVVKPGQVAKFSFAMSAPDSYAAGTYKEYFVPILEGTSGLLPDLGIYYQFAVSSTPALTYTTSPTNASLAANQPGTLSYTIKNSGNATLASGTQILATDTLFKTSAWSSDTVITTTSSAVAAGSSFTVNVPVMAPSQNSTSTRSLQLWAKSGSTTIPKSSHTTNVSVAGASFRSAYAGQSNYPSLSYNQTGTVSFNYKNSGNQPWYDDSSLSAATWRASHPVHLATTGPINRTSSFATSSWPGAARPAVNFAAVYEADGTTLASNQHVVMPGQIAKYSFTVTPQASVPAGTYTEAFRPILEGTGNGTINDVGTYQNITVKQNTYRMSYVGQSANPTINPGSTGSMTFKYKNTGNAVWYDNSSLSSALAPSKTYPVHLATSNPLNRNSDFAATWPGAARPAVNFAAVYEADGTTLASNQHVAQPGQIVAFTFTVSVPNDKAAGQYKEYVRPIAEGTPDGLFNDVGAFTTVIVP